MVHPYPSFPLSSASLLSRFLSLISESLVIADVALVSLKKSAADWTLGIPIVFVLLPLFGLGASNRKDV